MKSSPKFVLIYVFFSLFPYLLSAQYTSTDFISESFVSQGINAPGRMAVDSDDNIYVADAIQKNIAKYDNQGFYISTISTDFHVNSIAINDGNKLFASDAETGNIFIISQNGDKTLFYSGLSAVNSMVFASNTLYVTDSEMKLVVGIDFSGNVVSEFTYEKFVYPTGIAFDQNNNYLLVAEHGGIGEDMEKSGGCSICWSSYGPQTAVYVFDLQGNHIRTFGIYGYEDGEFQRIQGIDVGTCGNYYTVDPYLGRVSVFDVNGNFITKFGLQGNGIGEFNLPMDIVFTSDNRAIVSSMNKGAIDVFSILESLPTATITTKDASICAETTTSIEIHFTGSGPWNFTYTIDGLNPIELTTEQSVYHLTASEPGLYEVTALTDKDGIAGTCFTGAVNIEVKDLPTVNLLSTEFIKCAEDETGLALQFTGISPWTFTYTIDGLNPTEVTTEESTYSINPEKSGYYQIISLADSSCSVVEPAEGISVTVHPLPTAKITNEEEFARIYPGQTADLTIEFTGTAPYTFTYIRETHNIESFMVTTSENPYTLTLSEKGTYEILSVSDLNCTNASWQGFFDVFHTALPTATIITSNIEVCSGESEDISIEFTGTGPWTFTYTINGQNPTSLTTSERTYQLNASEPGIYELVALKDAAGIDGTFSGNTVFSTFESPVIDMHPEVHLCRGETAILDAGIFDSYQWSTGETTQTIEVDSAGTYSVMVTDTNGCFAEATTEVIVNELPVIDMEHTVEICQGDVTILDAGTFDSYLWSTGETTQTIEVDSEGRYSVTVTLNGCSSEAFVEVLVNEIPIIDLATSFELCQGEMKVLNAGKFDSYLWSTGETTQTIKVRDEGIYTVTVFNENGCSSQGQVEVIVNELPLAEITGNLEICPDTSTILHAGEHESYLWSTGETTPTIEVSKAGDYSVIITNSNGCSAESTVQVLINSIPEIELDDMVEICEGSTAVLDPGTFETYQWSTGATTQTIEVETAGTFSVTVTDNKGCTNIAFVEVKVNALPVINMVETLAICQNETTTLDPGKFSSYLWNTGETTRTIDVNTAGTYTVEVTNKNGCTSQASVEVTLNDLPVVNMAESVEICQGSTTILNAGSFDSYLWNTGETTQSIEVGVEGYYTVTVTNSLGCTAEATVELLVNELPSADLGHDIDICETELPYVLDPGSYASYKWNDGSTNRTFEVTSTGTYSVTVKNASGCEITTSVHVTVHPMVTADFYYEGQQEGIQFYSAATNADSHYWDFGDGKTSTEEHPVHSYKNKGDYTVTYIASSEFCGEAEKTEIIEVRSSATDDVVLVYPNPSYGEFTIKIDPENPINSEIRITIKSLSGQIIYMEAIDPLSNTSYDGNIYIEVNLTNYSSGIYLIDIEAGNFSTQEKLVLKD